MYSLQAESCHFWATLLNACELCMIWKGKDERLTDGGRSLHARDFKGAFYHHLLDYPRRDALAALVDQVRIGQDAGCPKGTPVPRRSAHARDRPFARVDCMIPFRTPLRNCYATTDGMAGHFDLRLARI